MDDCEPVSTAMALNCDEPPTAMPSSTVPSESLAMDDANKKFEIDSSAIRSVPTSEQAEELQALGLNVYDQTVLEEGILQQVDRAFQQQENRRQRQTASKALESVLDDIRSVKIRLKQIDKALALMPKIGDGVCKEVRRQVEAIEREKENKLKHLKSLRAKQHSLSAHLDGESGFGDSDVDSEGNVLDVETKLQLDQVLGIQKALETEQEKLIRTGQMTPFGTVVTSSKLASGEPARRLKVTNELTDFEKYLLDQAQLQKSKLKKHTSPSKQAEQNSPTAGSSGGNKSTLGSPKTPGKRSASVKSEANNNGDSPLPSTSKLWPPLLSPPPKRKRRRKEDVGTLIEGVDDKKIRRKKTWPDPNANSIDLEELEREAASGSEYNPSGSQDSSSEEENKVREKIMMTKTKKAKNLKKSFDECSKDLSNSEEESAPLRIDHKKVVDDGNQADYLKRIKKWKRALLVEKHRAILRDGEEDGKNEEDEEVKEGFEEFDGGFRVPLQIWNKLFRYQQTCVRWMWELHCQRCGGIMGDEMGLGKTIQAITYLAGLSQSNVCSKDGKFKGLGPVIIVTPTTVMHQWVREFHAWWPPFRVAILHDSGSYTGTKESLVRNINSFPGILITSYNGITIHQDLLLKYDWHYILLDEGHKIRNPDARATLVCKQFRTPHRVILSGSPLQNSLKELWSLFDFIFPGKLGTLPVFMQQFAVPITHGGYSNASKVQVQTAYRCAVVLRDTISPYLLRRMKSDVKMNLDLPNKNEQVLFCRLTEEQRSLYKEYLDSKEIQSILDGRLQVFVGLVNLRKICNHPDLYSGGPKVFGKVDPSTLSEDMHYGYWKRAGKMVVIEAILKLWFRQGHRVLLFSQSKQMLDILERFIKIQNYTFLRMDGGTSIGSRQPLVAKFNNDPSIFIFLLTTRVGGLGVNLTGANRVVIYDPDWNPSTDMQARERAWRIGQQRDVTIYRLLTSGTIEEKIYHRQIFKQFLTNRVLKDPRQRRFFKSNDMFELFSLREEGTQGTETSAIFSGTGSEVQVPSKADQKKATGERSSTARSCLSDDKIKKMRDLAKKLSQKIGEKASKEPGREPNDETEAGPSMATDLTCSGVCHGKENLEKGRLQDDKRKKKKRQATKFEGVKMDFLVRKDTFKSTGQEQEESATNVRQDEYVLQKLFAKTGVHAALKHDTIIDASDPDYMLVEGEADRVAKEAVKVLKNSRRHCYHAESGIPTWTGSNGLSGAPPEFKAKARFGKKRNTKLLTPNQEVQSLETDKAVATMSMRLGESRKAFLGEPQSSSTGDAPMSSSQLLFRMKQRNHLNPAVANDDDEDDENLLSSSAVTSDGGVAAEQRLTTEYDELLVDIRNFIAFQCAVDGEATTEEILQTFKDRVPAKDSAVFKALLKKICIFARNVHGTGVWQLRGEFR